MVVALTCTWTEPNTRASGRMTNSMVRAMKHGQMGRLTKVATSMVKNKDRVTLFGQTVQNILVSSWTTTLKEKVCMFGTMAACSKATGNKTKWRAKAFSPGLTADATWDSTWTIRSRERACLAGQTAEYTTASGSMANSTALVCTRLQAVKPKQASGKTENAFAGCESDLLNVAIA